MSIRVQCGVCSRQFVAPDEVRGRRFKCPACSSPIDVPYDDDQPAIDLRWSESPASAAPSAIPAISPEMTQREVFGRPTSAPPLPSSPSLTQPNRKADLPTFIFSHRLVLAVFAFCVAFVALGAHYEHQVAGVMLAFFGIGIGAGAWRSQSLLDRKDREAEDWRTVERIAGIVSLIALAMLITWSSGRQIYEGIESARKFGFDDKVTTHIIVSVAVWLLFVAFFAFVYQMSQRHGFFKPASWTYIGVFFLAWPMMASNFGDELNREQGVAVAQQPQHPQPGPIQAANNRRGFDGRPDRNAGIKNRPDFVGGPRHNFGPRGRDPFNPRMEDQSPVQRVIPSVPSSTPKLSPKDYPTLVLGRLTSVPSPDALSTPAIGADRIAAVNLGEGADNQLRERRPAVSWAAKPDPQIIQPPSPAKTRLAQIPVTADSQVFAPSIAGPWIAVSSGGKEFAKTLQAYNVLTGEDRKVEGKIAIASPQAPSLDGKYFAAFNSDEHSVDVWSLDPGKLLARIPLSDMEKPSLVAFAGTNRLIIAGDAGNSARKAAVCRIWNLAQPQVPTELALPRAVKFSGGAATISPAGKLLAVYADASVWLIDLATGKLAGKLALKESDTSERFHMKPGGLSFSPDGEELACLIHRFRGARLAAWNMSDGSPRIDHRSEAEFKDFSSQAPKAIECLPDHTGWLVDGRALVDAKTGDPAWLGLAYKQSNIEKHFKVYGLASADRLIIGSPNMITTWVIPRDLSGNLEAKSLFVSADDLPSGMLPEVDPYHRRSTAEEEQTLTGDELELACRKYRHAAQLKILAGSDEKLGSLLGWYPAAKRPAFGLRVGIGAQAPDGSKDLIPLSSSTSLTDFTGPVGPKIVEELRKRFVQDAFGDWPPFEESAARGVVYVGIGPRGKVLPVAKQSQLDVVVMIEVTQQQIGNTKRFNRLLRVRLSDAAGEFVWVSPPLNSEKVVAAERDKQDLIKPFIDELMNKVDDLYSLKPLPEIKADAAKQRAATIAKNEVVAGEQLSLAAELRHYQIVGLLSAEDALPAYRNLFDDETAIALARGDGRQRRSALEKWAAANPSN